MPLPLQVSASEQVRKCHVCQKPFLKENAFNRHVSYCRRASNRHRVRGRACRSCASAKTKCNLQSKCQRCIKKGIECFYDTPANIAAVLNRSVPTGDPSSQADNLATTQGWLPGEITTPTSNERCAQEYLPTDMEWNNLFDFEMNQLMHPNSNGTLLCFPNPSMTAPDSLLPHNYYDAEVLDSRTPEMDPNSFMVTGKPWSIPTDQHNDRSLVRSNNSQEEPNDDQVSPITRSDPISNSTARVVMQMLRAFPQMMLRRETLPPFIHGHWYQGPSSTESVLPEPLVNCMGITQVFASRSRETKPFLWRTIQSEQQNADERTNQGKLAKQALLASIQAQLIYMIMRITDEKPTTEPSIEKLVIRQPLCQKFKELCKEPFFEQESHNPSFGWEDWIFAESRRRAAVVWFLVTQVVCLKIGVSYELIDEFRKIPLPSPRSLWEARTRAEWQAEREIYKSQSRMGLETVGDLINATRESSMPKNEAVLDTWNAGIDNLGILLNLSVSVI